MSSSKSKLSKLNPAEIDVDGDEDEIEEVIDSPRSTTTLQQRHLATRRGPVRSSRSTTPSTFFLCTRILVLLSDLNSSNNLEFGIILFLASEKGPRIRPFLPFPHHRHLHAALIALPLVSSRFSYLCLLLTYSLFLFHCILKRFGNKSSFLQSHFSFV